jgi:hypothetical protein
MDIIGQFKMNMIEVFDSVDEEFQFTTMSTPIDLSNVTQLLIRDIKATSANCADLDAEVASLLND